MPSGKSVLWGHNATARPHFSASVKVIPHRSQRYDTAGDWLWGSTHRYETVTIQVSRMPDWRMEFLVALHELVEAALCRQAGITANQVDAWDRAHPDDNDPGGILAAPYNAQHALATRIERIVSDSMGVSWDEYSKAIEELK